MTNEQFQAWLKSCFEDDAKARRLIMGTEPFPQLNEPQREFIVRVLDKAWTELGLVGERPPNPTQPEVGVSPNKKE